MKKLLLIFLFLGCCIYATMAQNALRVTGSVLDATDKSPVAFATVSVKGSNIVTMANDIGVYAITVNSPNDILVFSMIGMITKEEPVGGRAIIHVMMQPTASMLEEVIVTGYRTIAKEHATGSYTVLSKDVLEKAPVANISSALRGWVPGMTGVSSSTNADGDDTRFIIRGVGTIQGQVDRDPLIVVDGFPIQGVSSIVTNRQINDPFSTINPNDVESITVLKDAAATSIYGARAANGVIVITTKRGRAGEKVSVSVNAFTSVSSKLNLDHYYDLASPETIFWHAENRFKWDPTYNTVDLWQNAANPFNDARRDYEMMLFECFRLGNMTQQEYNTRKAEMIALGNKGLWKDDLNKYYYRNKIHQQYNVAIRGGSATHNYSLSFAFDKDNSYVRDDDNQRIMINLTNSIRFGSKVTLNVGINGSIEKGNGAAGTAYTTAPTTATVSSTANTNVFGDPTAELAQVNPWTRFVDNDGNFLHYPVATYTVYEPILRNRYGDKLPVSWDYNPIENRKYTKNTDSRLILRVNAGLDYNITSFLKIKLAGQYERNQYLINYTFDPESFLIRSYNNRYSTLNAGTGKYETYFPDGGMLYEAGTRYEGYMGRLQADFNKRFGSHAVTLLVGTEVSASTNYKVPEIFRYGYNKFTGAALTSVDYFTQSRNIFGINERMPYATPGLLNIIEDRFFSAYIDAQYTLKDRYNITASARTDASNFLAIDVRDKFSPFWSLGAAWLMSQENFIKDIKWISSLKLRASLGLAGLAAGKSTNSAITTVGVSAGSILHTNNEPYSTISSRGNPNLTWEKSRIYDIGVDFNLWNNKLYGGFSYYDRYSYDVLASATVPSIAQGVTSATFNNAAISNRGVELSLGTNLTIVGDLQWNAMVNFSYNKNRVVKYNVINTSKRPTYYVGYPIGGVWGWNVIRYTPEGYQVLLGRDGTETIAVDRTSSQYNTVVGAGEKVEEDQFSFYSGYSLTPEYNLGFMNSFTFKGITLSFKMTGKFSYLFQDRSEGSTGGIKGTLLEKAKKVWDEGYANQKSYTAMPLLNADNATVFVANNTYSTYLIPLHRDCLATSFRGDHIRLNEIYLGYELPNRLLSKLKAISGIKIYAQAKNLGVIWALNKEYSDPESLPGTFKPMKVFTFGINFNFNTNN